LIDDVSILESLYRFVKGFDDIVTYTIDKLRLC